MSPTTSIDMRLQHPCPTCKQMGRPLKRIWGYPNNFKELARHQAEGRIRIMGCCIFEGQSDYECRHCAADWPMVSIDPTPIPFMDNSTH